MCKSEKSNIILTGFMGSGKSTVGKTVAKRLNMNFVDMDDYIEQNEKMNISEIFNKYGEEYFRKCETEAAKILGNAENTVISCGGGTVMNSQNVEFLKRQGTVFYLNADITVLFSRISNDTSRPLAKNKDKITLATLLEKRKPVYLETCDVIIDANNKVEDVAEQICRLFI